MKNNLWQKIFLSLFILALSGCTHQPDISDSSLNSPTKNLPDNTIAKPLVEPAPHPVSLPALFAKELTGSDLTLGQILADNNSYTRYYITYQSNELTISGIMNVPKGNGPFPALILNHGHIDTSIYTNGRGLRREQDYLARQGYVVLHTDYRNHAQSDKDDRNTLAVRLAYTEDAINAVYAIKNSNFDFIDKENIGMLGHSMGGGVTLTSLITRPDLIKTAVLYAPVSGNMSLSYERWLSKNINNEIPKLYGAPDENPDFWRDLSAENYYNRIKAPIMIFHGTNDDSVPLEWSQNTLIKLQDNNVEAELVVYQNELHEFGPEWTDFMQQSANFFDQYLK